MYFHTGFAGNPSQLFLFYWLLASCPERRQDSQKDGVLTLSLQRKSDTLGCHGLNMCYYLLTAAPAAVMWLWTFLGAGLGLQCALAVGKGGAGSFRFFQLSIVVIKWSHHWHKSRGLHGLGLGAAWAGYLPVAGKRAAVQMCLQFDNTVNHVVKARWSAQGKLHNRDDIEIPARPHSMTI